MTASLLVLRSENVLTPDVCNLYMLDRRDVVLARPMARELKLA